MAKIRINKVPGTKKVRVKGLPNAAYGGSSYSGIPGSGNQTAPFYNSKDSLGAPDFKVGRNLPAVPRDQANIEAERGETVLMPDQGGLPAHFNVGGNRHHGGGTPLNVPEDSFVFSDTRKMRIKDPNVLAEFGKKKGSWTPAQLAKPYDINKYRKILQDPDSDNLDVNNAEKMIANYNLKLGKLALIQESKKGFPQGIPAVAMPYLMTYAVTPDMILPLKAEEEQTQDIPHEEMPMGKYGMSIPQYQYAGQAPNSYDYLRPDPSSVEYDPADDDELIAPISQDDDAVIGGPYGPSDLPDQKLERSRGRMKEKFGKFTMNPEDQVNWGLAGAQLATSAFNAKDTRKREQDLQDRFAAENIFASEQGRDRGDYTRNQGYFRPDDTVTGNMVTGKYGIQVPSQVLQAKQKWMELGKGNINSDHYRNYLNALSQHTSARASQNEELPKAQDGKINIDQIPSGADIERLRAYMIKKQGERQLEQEEITKREEYKKWEEENRPKGPKLSGSSIAIINTRKEKLNKAYRNLKNKVEGVYQTGMKDKSFNLLMNEYYKAAEGYLTVAPKVTAPSTDEFGPGHVFTQPAIVTETPDIQEEISTAVTEPTIQTAIADTTGDAAILRKLGVKKLGGELESYQEGGFTTKIVDGKITRTYEDGVITIVETDGSERIIHKPATSAATTATATATPTAQTSTGKKGKSKFGLTVHLGDQTTSVDPTTNRPSKTWNAGVLAKSNQELNDLAEYLDENVKKFVPGDYKGKNINEKWQRYLYTIDGSFKGIDGKTIVPNFKEVIDKRHSEKEGFGTPQFSKKRFDGFIGTRWLGALKDINLEQPEKKKEDKIIDKTPIDPAKDPTFTRGRQDAPWWLQDVVNTAASFGNRASLRKYLPWAPQVQLHAPEPTFFDPTRELAANAEQMAIGTQGAGLFSGPQAYNARASQIQGQGAKNAANVLANYHNKNVGVANQFETLRTDVLNKNNMLNAQTAKGLYDGVTIANQQFDNAKRQANDEIRGAYVNAITNRAQTQAMNTMYPHYQVDPMSGGFLDFYKGSDLSNEMPSDKAAQYLSLMERPGMTENAALALLGYGDKGAKTSSPTNIDYNNYLVNMQRMNNNRFPRFDYSGRDEDT